LSDPAIGGLSLLDSLYCGTTYPHRFVFIDMASDDPLVPQVVAGFERRGMFSRQNRRVEEGKISVPS
jgi:hypothetical protein